MILLQTKEQITLPQLKSYEKCLEKEKPKFFQQISETCLSNLPNYRELILEKVTEVYSLKDVSGFVIAPKISYLKLTGKPE